MTDSSSDDQELVANLVQDVLEAKMDAAQAERTLVHRLRLGVFEMEIVPDGNDVTEFFKEMVDKLHKMYGEEVLKARILHDEGGPKKTSAHMHG
tara:strand:+ start:161 stop:442 length:282 start_codon:yes stop_codon:yes gene_type:complete